MAASVYGHGVFGVAQPLRLLGFPKGRVRLRIRQNDFVKAFVNTADGLRAFYVAEKDGAWVPSYEIGRNMRK